MAKKRAVTAEQGFLESITTNPEDDTPRLVYADWLDDQGQSERAEFIRLQIQLARMSEDDPQRPNLVDREQELFQRHRVEWREFLPAWAKKEWPKFGRGF